MNSTTSAEQREACPLCAQRDDTYCLHPGPGGDLWTCPACGHDWTLEVTEPARRVLVTGSRTWTDTSTIRDRSPGASQTARLAEDGGIPTQRHHH